MITEANYIPSPEQIDAILTFLPIFERKDFSPSRVEMPSGQFPHHVFAAELSQFHQAVYDGGFVFSFDWPAWQGEAERYVEQPELLHSANLEVLRKLITVHVRKERFCEGHLPTMVQSGHMTSLLRRLKELRVGPLYMRTAREDELERINDAYTEFGYSGKAAPNDTIILAERGTKIIGLVRRTEEQGVTLLRGMYVSVHAQRQGVGSALLSRFVELLDGQDCYCIPYTHLVGFYASGGFAAVPPERAPAFLRERLEQYQQDGDVLLMGRLGNERPG